MGKSPSIARNKKDFKLVKRSSVMNLSVVSLSVAQSKELISRKAAIGNCVASLDNA